MVQDLVVMKKRGRIAEITIDHPPMNTISVGILQRLAELVTACEQDDSIRAIHLDSANQKPPFAADAADLMANPSWEKQFLAALFEQRSIEFTGNEPKRGGDGG